MKKQQQSDTCFDFTGSHLLAEFYGCDYCESEQVVHNMVLAATIAGDVQLLNFSFHAFDTGGFTAIALLAESHLSIHTYPEHRAAFIDIFTCGSHDPLDILTILKQQMNPATVTHQCIQRGQSDV